MGYVKNAPETKRWTVDGNPEVRIVDYTIAEPRFSPNDPEAFDVGLKVQALDGSACDWWTSEVSANYGTGNNSHRTRAEITMDTLMKLGLPDGDLTKLASLVGVETVAWIKKTEKANAKGETVCYYNVAGLGGVNGSEPKALDKTEILRRMSAQKARSSGTQAPAPTQPATQSIPKSAPVIEDIFS